MLLSVMNTTNTKNKVEEQIIKSVGFCADDGSILDDSAGVEEFKEYVLDEDCSNEIGFEEGMVEMKEYVERFGTQEDWVIIEEKLMKLKEEVGNKGVWVGWGVEYDYSLAVIL